MQLFESQNHQYRVTGMVLLSAIISP